MYRISGSFYCYYEITKSLRKQIIKTYKWNTTLKIFYH